ncbi:hypothetical protein AQUCO_03600081v1 [Aquilegia coerulea]|uniref:Uncharacterized protein n=1 Tax=Aquilegia coerulea TaxID=218851 RepID=A0A2G5CV60_AQUCA|nr:hypothetical protein AQUCO_03600081v1 [Aquilegia coerulea]
MSKNLQCIHYIGTMYQEPCFEEFIIPFDSHDIITGLIFFWLQLASYICSPFPDLVELLLIGKQYNM